MYFRARGGADNVNQSSLTNGAVDNIIFLASETNERRSDKKPAPPGATEVSAHENVPHLPMCY